MSISRKGDVVYACGTLIVWRPSILTSYMVIDTVCMKLKTGDIQNLPMF